MALAIVYTRAKVGVTAPLVTVEAHLSNGLPGFSIVGLPEATVKESKDRVRSAIINSNFTFPVKRITINLAPADLPKDGGRFDLPIALGILAASGQINDKLLNNIEFIGELALSGELRPVRGSLPAAIYAGKAQRCICIATQNSQEAGLAVDTDIIPAKSLLEVCAHLDSRQIIKPFSSSTNSAQTSVSSSIDFQDIAGQHAAKHALEVAAAGGHNLLMVGPPGTGKTMLASRLHTILPPMNADEALEVASIKSIVSSHLSDNSWQQRPFRSPHHTISSVALVGGGSSPKPGEISLAHKGILFLDELPEYPRKTLDVLREPLESGEVTISRVNSNVTFPAQFQLIAAMNPCPCGYLQSKTRDCSCSPDKVRRYQASISGPLLDRIDMHLEVMPLEHNELIKDAKHGDSSETIRKRVIAAHKVQHARQGKINAELSAKEVKKYCMLGSAESDFLSNIMQKLNLSARSYTRILKVSRTIADLAKAENIEKSHISATLGYRYLDRKIAF